MINLNDILLLSPEITLVIGTFVVIIVDLFSPKKSYSAIFTEKIGPGRKLYTWNYFRSKL